MDATKDFDYMDDLGLRLSRITSVPKNSGEIIIVKIMNEKMCMGFYCDSDVLQNLYLTHVTIISKGNGKSRRLRRCWIKNHIIRDMFIVGSNEDTSRASNEETWNDRISQKQFQDSATCEENAVLLSRLQCSVNLSRIACDKTKSECTNDEQWEMDVSNTCDQNHTELHYTGVHVWKHVTSSGKSWDINTVDSTSGNMDVMKAITDVHWGGGIIARSRRCHS